MPNTRSIGAGERLAAAEQAAAKSKARLIALLAVEVASAHSVEERLAALRSIWKICGEEKSLVEVYYRYKDSDVRRVVSPGSIAMLVAKEMIRIEGMAFGSLRVRELHGAMWFADAELAQYGRAA